MANINITEGNDVTLKATLMRDGEMYPVELSEEVHAEVVSRIGGRTSCGCEVTDAGMVLVDVPGSLLPGGYIVAVYGVLDGAKWRSACRGLLVTRVTEGTSLTEKAESIVSDGDVYDITMEVQMYKADVPGAIAAHNQDKTAHADIRELIPTLPKHIVTDADYVHTDNNYGDSEKEKLQALPTKMQLDELQAEKADLNDLSWEKSEGKGSAVLKDSGSHANGEHSVAEGLGNIASGAYSHAEGSNSKAIGNRSHSEGYNTVSEGNMSHAEGNAVVALGSSSHAEGSGGIASANVTFSGAANGTTYTTTTPHDLSVGMVLKFRDIYSKITSIPTTTSFVTEKTLSTTEVTNSTDLYVSGGVASGNSSHVEGDSSMANGDCSHAEGYSTSASGNQSHAEGNLSKAKGTASHAEGHVTEASGPYSHSEGITTKATGAGSHAEGNGTQATKEGAHAEGNFTMATGIASHAEGLRTEASSPNSHAEGYASRSTSTSSHAEGYVTVASGEASHSEGQETTASGNYSHAEGNGTQATNAYAHAEGNKSVARGSASHAEGFTSETGGSATSNTKTSGTITTAGAYAHAEGNATIAKGVAAHSEGKLTFASGKAAHAEGVGTEAKNEGEHAEGFYNRSTVGKTIHSVGIGTSSRRENAFEITKDGSVFIYGLGGYDGTNPETALALQSCVNRVAVKQETITDDEILLCKSNIIYEVSYDGVIMVGLDTSIADVKNEYCIKFDVASTIPTLLLPNYIIWAEEIELEANTHYVILVSYENGRYYGDWKSYPLT